MAADIMLDVLIRSAIVIVTGFLFIIVFIAYLRMGTTKLLFISVGFGVLFLHSVLLMPEVMIENFTMGFTDNVHLLIQLVGMLFITIGILKD